MPRWIVTERTSVDADTKEEAIDRVVNCIKGGYQDVMEQSAILGHDASAPHPRVRVELGVPASEQADRWQNGTLQHSRDGDVAFTIQTHIDIDASDPGDARTVEEAAVDQLRDILETFTAAHPRVRFNVIVGTEEEV